jgi:hypothetical protein
MKGIYKKVVTWARRPLTVAAEIGSDVMRAQNGPGILLNGLVDILTRICQVVN